MSMQDIVLNVNGIDYELKIRSTRSLADVLREDIGLIGTKLFCNEGECGACTVIVDGTTALSCMMLAIDCEGRKILTIEGLADHSGVGICHDVSLVIKHDQVFIKSVTFFDHS